jgi:hypothetical protein
LTSISGTPDSRVSPSPYQNWQRATGADIKAMQELHWTLIPRQSRFTNAKLKVMSFGSVLLVLVAAEPKSLPLCLFVPSRTG